MQPDPASSPPRPPRGRRPTATGAPGRPLRVAHVTTVPVTLGFMRGQPAFMRARGVEELAISSPGPELELFQRTQDVACYAIPMERGIAPLRDLASLSRLVRLLRRLRPDVVDAHTPKAALLGMLAAWLAGVPVRVHHVHGLRYVTTRGARRALLRATERLASGLATRVLCVSRSVAETTVAEGLAPAAKVKVILHGSIAGVDADRLRPPASAEERAAARRRLGLPPDARVLAFVGRRAREKGLAELEAAWRRLREELPDLHLLLLGPEEPGDPPPPEVTRGLAADPRVHAFGFDWDTLPYYQAADVLALPSWREGFPVVPLEAAAVGVPVVATRVPGCTDAVVDGVTGTLVPPRAPEALAAALRAYLLDPALRARHGAAARERARRDFRPERIWAGLRDEYAALAAEARLA